MQSQSPPLVQHTETETPLLRPGPVSTQHGHAHVKTPPLPSPDDSRDGRVSLFAGSDQVESRTALSQPAIHGLNTSHSPYSASRNRVTEYENASKSSTPRRMESLGFEVIKKPRKPGDKHAPILDLPNGMCPGVPAPARSHANADVLT